MSTPALVLNVSQPWHNESTEAGVSQPVIPNCAPSQPHPTMVAERTSTDENPTDALAEPVHAQLAADARNPSTVVLVSVFDEEASFRVLILLEGTEATGNAGAVETFICGDSQTKEVGRLRDIPATGGM